MAKYRLCLLGPTARIAKVRRYWASTDEGALAMAREMLSDDPTLIGLLRGVAASGYVKLP